MSGRQATEGQRRRDCGGGDSGRCGESARELYEALFEADVGQGLAMRSLNECRLSARYAAWVNDR